MNVIELNVLGLNLMNSEKENIKIPSAVFLIILFSLKLDMLALSLVRVLLAEEGKNYFFRVNDVHFPPRS